MGADTRIAEAEIQKGNGPKLAGILLDDLVKLVCWVFVEAILGVPFTQAQGLLIFPEPHHKLRAIRLNLFLAQVFVGIGTVVLGIAFPVGVRWMECPILGHLLEGLIGGGLAEGFIDPVVGPGTGLGLIDEDISKLMRELVGNLVPCPAIANAEHDLRFTLGPALIQVHREAVIRLWNQDGFELPPGIIAGNGHGGRLADHLKILRIGLEPLLR